MRIRKQESTELLPFALLYQREPVLPNYIDWNLIEYKDGILTSNNKTTILKTFNKMEKKKKKKTKKCFFDETHENIRKSQTKQKQKQKRDYDKSFKPKKVLLLEQKCYHETVMIEKVENL